MTTRTVSFKPNNNIAACPTCGNNTDFTIHSAQVAEDLCEVWAACKCGREPASGHRYEDVCGGVHDDNVQIAISCWTDAFSAV